MVQALPGGVSTSTSWGQNVFVFMNETMELNHANVAANRIFKDPTPNKGPHMSLLYGNQPAKEREAAADLVRKNKQWVNSGFSFNLTELRAWITNCDCPEQWELLGAWSLR
mmetsp:Transcript_12199/g.19321  ORF Transcript_12199/g.19321 Transcript_12199/m.19321 type:complete len:111 (+) Transcript_12199:416-748(+)